MYRYILNYDTAENHFTPCGDPLKFPLLNTQFLHGVEAVQKFSLYRCPIFFTDINLQAFFEICEGRRGFTPFDV